MKKRKPAQSRQSSPKWRTTHAQEDVRFVCTKETKCITDIKMCEREKKKKRMMPLQTLSTEKTTVNSPQTPLKERVPSQNCIQGCSFLHLQVSGKCMFLRRGTINNAPTYVHRATCQLPVNNCQRRSPM